MINKRFDLIEKADIEALVANAVSESRVIDYKETLPGNADADKREFLADVSSFANAAGGDLIYGIREQRDSDGKPTGIPESVAGLAGVNVDAEILRLENILRDGLDPRAPGVQMRHVDGFTAGPAILIRIPKSWASPHMMIFKGSSRFYSRTSRGKYEMDVREIRTSFASSEALPERIRRFRDDRLAKIVAGETPVPMEDGPRMVLHVLPVASFDPATRLDLSVIQEPSLKLQPISTSGWNHRFNLDGILCFTQYREDALSPNYTQLFRNGAIEAVATGLLRERDGKKVIASVAYEQELIIALNRYLTALKSFGLTPPIVVMLTVIGAKGYSMSVGFNYWGGGVIDRDMLLLPEVIVEDYGTNAASIFRPIFDTFWQAAGWERSLNYDKNGNWKAHA